MDLVAMVPPIEYGYLFIRTKKGNQLKTEIINIHSSNITNIKGHNQHKMFMKEDQNIFKPEGRRFNA